MIFCQLFPWSRDYTDVYDRYGLLGPKTLLGHCIHLGERERAVLGEERLARLQVEGDGGCAGSGDVWDGERLREAGGQWRLTGAGRAGEDERGENDDRQTATGHLTQSAEHEHDRQA